VGSSGVSSRLPVARLRWWRRAGVLITHDFKEADKYVEWMWSPLGSQLLAALATLLGGFFLHPHCFVLFWAILAMLVLGAAWPWLALAGLSGTLAFSKQRCREGEAVELKVRVRSRLPWGAWGLMTLGLKKEGVAGGTAAENGHGLPYVPGRKETSQSWTFVPPRRGVYPQGRPALGCGFPFGLWVARRPLLSDGELLAWPRTFPVTSLPAEAGEQNQDRGVYRDQPGTMGDILGVRPYRRGDSLRRVHWPQSARHDRLIVCERQSAALPTVRLLLDVDPTVHRGFGSDSSLEWSIRVMASFVQGWSAAGARLEMACGRTFFAADGGLAQQRRLFDALARLTPGDALPLAEMLARPELRELQSGATVIVTTDLALAKLPGRWLRASGLRWVVLRADCFSGGCHDHSQHLHLPLRPWLLLTNPEHLSHQLRPEGLGVCRAG
jgi:uncharacterized protein (DUF58 family)